MYDVFAQFYDRAEGDSPAGFASWIRNRVAAHGRDVASILELGCGTGAVLEALPAEWAKTGVDLSPAMLDQARAKGVKARLVEGDITDVDLGERFDVVACVFDTLNHVIAADGWRRTFAVARRHVADGGLFLFDVNTLGRLGEMAASGAHVLDLGGDVVVMQVRRREADVFDWHLRVFEQVGDLYRQHAETITETSFALDDVRSWLAEAGFMVVEAVSAPDVPAEDGAGRAFFVCRLAPSA